MDTVQHHLFFLGQFGHHLVAVLHEALLFLVQILLDRLGLRAGYQPFLYLVLIVAHVVLETAALGSQLRIGLFGLLLVGGPQVDVHVVSADERVDVEIGYVSARCAELMGKPIEELKLISCHLGNGSSVTAIDGGKSVDTSMGFTPLAGLPMGTRSGDLDAGILQYLMNKYGMNIDEMLNILNKKSGVEGLSGVSSDFRDLEKAAEEGNARAQLAEEKFAYEVKKYVGAYAAAMGGVDAIIFTAGVGENDKGIRAMVCDGLEYMGVKLDPAANDVRGKETVISAADSKVKVLLIPTNEELMIATDTAAIVKGN